jgi:hypothetical protein
MRFPTAKTVQDFTKFNLGIKSVNAQIAIEPWSSAVGAKGKLQQAWFRVAGIPLDQRGVKTIAKVGGLVGKTVAIDDSTRFHESVRVKIACRNVNEVPDIAEGTLGTNIYDFFFEMESPSPYQGERIKSGVRIEEQGGQASPKKMKTGHGGNEGKEVTPGKSSSQKDVADTYGKKCGMNESCMSAPGKMYNEKVKDKEFSPMDEDEAIPAANYESSESSDDFQLQVDNVLGDEAESSKRRSSVWLARCDLLQKSNENTELQETSMQKEMEEQNMSEDVAQEGPDLTKLINPCEQMKEGRQERRWSERLLKITEESNKNMTLPDQGSNEGN